MTPEQFDATVSIMRATPNGSPSRDAARAYLVDGTPYADAARAAGVKIEVVRNLVYKIRATQRTAAIAAGKELSL